MTKVANAGPHRMDPNIGATLRIFKILKSIQSWARPK